MLVYTMEMPSSVFPNQNSGIHGKIQCIPGPLIVHVQYIEMGPKSGTVLYPLHFSYFFCKLGLCSVIENGVKRVGRNRLSIPFSTTRRRMLLFKMRPLQIHKDIKQQFRHLLKWVWRRKFQGI